MLSDGNIILHHHNAIQLSLRGAGCIPAEIEGQALLPAKPDPGHAGVGKDAVALTRIAVFRLSANFFEGMYHVKQQILSPPGLV